MRALIFEGPRRMVLREVPVPEPGEGDVLILVHAAAICGSDVRILSGRKTREVRVGHPIGHECAGMVAALGTGVTSLAPGDRVAVCVVVSCGTCPHCLADKENLCGTRITLGYHTDGAFAEYMLIPAQAVRRGNLFKLPDGIAMDAATLLEPLACCTNGQHEMGLEPVPEPGENAGSKPVPQESLVIFGAGPIGLLHLMLARSKGIGPITVVEPRDHRRELAGQLGADATCSPDAFDPAGQFDAAILAVGVPELVNVAMRAVKKSGRINLFAGFDQDARVGLDPNVIHYHQLCITGASESRRRDYAEALSLVSQHRVDPSPLLTHRFTLEGHEAAFRAAADGSALKVVFEMMNAE